MAILFVDNLSFNNNRVLQTAVKALELILLSAGLISTIVMVKGAVIFPYSCELVLSSLMGFWNSIRCLFSSPLYICIIINFIVVLIALSSAFHRGDNPDDETEVNNDDHDFLSNKSPPPPAPPPEIPQDIVEVVESPPPPPPPVKDITEVVLSSPDVEKTMFLSEELVPVANEMKESAYSFTIGTKEMDMEVEMDENEEDDTMEATWNAINGGGKKKPKKKYLKKSETWNVPQRAVKIPMQRLDSEVLMPSTPKWKELKKSETFDGAVSITCRGGLRRDPTMSLDDFNKQVEAFIKKFNDNMRLQRQESDQRFLDMINQGF